LDIELFIRVPLPAANTIAFLMFSSSSLILPKYPLL
jgi:hypothetical protein